MDALFKQILETVSFENVCKQRGYAFFTNGDFNLNIYGVRNRLSYPKGLLADKVTDQFDDAIVLAYKENGKWIKKIYECTVDPGSTYMKSPSVSAGTGIIVPNQYRGALKLGLHKNSYKALVQAKPMKLYRDNNKDLVYDMNPSTIQEGIFGVNIHKAGADSQQVLNWSAACTVFKKEANFKEFLSICEKAEKIWGNSFTYTVLELQSVFN